VCTELCKESKAAVTATVTAAVTAMLLEQQQHPSQNYRKKKKEILYPPPRFLSKASNHSNVCIQSLHCVLTEHPEQIAEQLKSITDQLGMLTNFIHLFDKRIQLLEEQMGKLSRHQQTPESHLGEDAHFEPQFDDINQEFQQFQERGNVK
jgi:hypothetical protein